MLRLFDVPPQATPGSSLGAYLGGIGAGSVHITPSGAFTAWRMEPGDLPAFQPVSPNRFHAWARSRGRANSTVLAAPESPSFTHRQLFPFTWTAYHLDSFPLVLESVAFSPLLPAVTRERSLPVGLVVFRANNPGDTAVEAALALTWACGWPAPIDDAEFDFQHDNLCLTGSLGSPAGPNRQGIAVPDLHYVGIYQQGIEPYCVASELPGVEADFADDGELEPRVVGVGPQGAAAWVKFDLAPSETKEVPFVMAWHFPHYARGRSAGKWRQYAQHLGRYRPDNAIVWLAEQAVQHFGAETANYCYWIQQLADWQRALGDEAAGVCGAIQEVMEAGTVWPTESRIEIEGPVSPESVRTASRFWPDLGP